MLRVALTGGIGSGKSAVAQRLRARGAVVVDADALAREVVAPDGEAYDDLRAEFGDDVFGSDGTLDRAALAAVVFGDAERLAVLNRITHPRVAARAAALVAASPPDAVVVYDVPLLVESGPVHGWDLVVVVDAPDDVRLRRLVADRGLDPGAVRRRMAAQTSRDQRLAVADVVIDNGGDLAALDAQVEALWRRLQDAARQGSSRPSSG